MASDKNRKVVGFKRFSDIKGKPKVEEVSPGITPDTDSSLPMNPNLPTGSRKIEKPASRKNLIPKDQDINLQNEDEDQFITDEETNEKKKVDMIGKVAKFPRGVKASKGYNFLESVKISKKSIWYLMIEKQENELQMVKYNVKEGVDLNKFVTELKGYYLKKYTKDKKVCKLIEGLMVDGNDKYSMVKNIPLITIDGRKMITIITEDLIKLLSR
jgi:hypothetical protein